MKAWLRASNLLAKLSELRRCGSIRIRLAFSFKIDWARRNANKDVFPDPLTPPIPKLFRLLKGCSTACPSGSNPNTNEGFLRMSKALEMGSGAAISA